ncbi:MAG: hypothetical protein ACYSUN_10060 [Planctomycetota bacterium]|jgi:hypothetical protein
MIAWLRRLVDRVRQRRASARAQERIADFQPEVVRSEEAAPSDPAPARR